MRESGRYTVFLDDRPIASISQIENKLDEEEAQWLVGLEMKTSLGRLPPLHGLAPQSTKARAANRASPNSRSSRTLRALLSYSWTLRGRWVVAGGWGLGLGGLWTDDLAAAGKPYGEVIGYDRSETDRWGQTYPLFEIDGEPRAGLVEIENKAVDPIWAPYLAVEDVAATVKKAKSLGGTDSSRTQTRESLWPGGIDC